MHSVRLVADVAMLAGHRVGLVRYRDVSRYDGQRGWFLPDDLLNESEHPDDAARRILRDQVGVDAPSIRLSHVESFGNGRWHLIFHYEARMDAEPALIPGANVAAAEWFELDALPPAAEQAHDGWAGETLGRVLVNREGVKAINADA